MAYCTTFGILTINSPNESRSTQWTPLHGRSIKEINAAVLLTPKMILISYLLVHSKNFIMRHLHVQFHSQHNSISVFIILLCVKSMKTQKIFGKSVWMLNGISQYKSRQPKKYYIPRFWIPFTIYFDVHLYPFAQIEYHRICTRWQWTRKNVRLKFFFFF